MDFSATLETIRTMNIDDRIRLVQAIWDDIANQEPEFQLSDAHKEEIDRRLEAYQAAPENVVSWEEVKKQAEERLRK